MKKFGKYLMIFLAAVLFIGTFVYLFQRSRPKEALYEEQEATVKDIVRTTVVTGKIQPRDEVNIKPQISGIISELYKEAGQTVKKDEIIAKVKVIPDMSSLSSAQSRVRLAEVNLNQAKTNYNREKALYDKSLVSADEYEKVLQAYNQAKEELAGAKEALEIIRDGVSSANASGSSTLVRSTISGLILDVPVKVGNSVTQSNTFNDGTTIATVADMEDLIFDGNIDETEVGRLSTGMPVKISVGALQDLSFDAVLEYISPKATVNNGANQFEIKASVKIPDGVTIRSGYSANAEIVLDKASGVVALPESAIQFEGEKTYVMIREAEGYVRRDVTTGLSDGIDIEIKEGVNAGDKVRGAQIIVKKNVQ
ncbi:MAG: efflux RND transporter periplasmic adaptor subunit [Bacteroidales bacterium]|nr:efflux RND transporter periplasmic adaptor subunit [Bacteroidales bacterium]